MKAALLATLFFLGLWQGTVVLTGVPGFILPSPARVGAAFWENRALIAGHAQITLLEIALGLAIGTVLGVLTALNLVISPLARMVLRPFLVFSQALPVFALAPILTLWFGFGIESKIVMTVLLIYFPVASALFDGLMGTPAGHLDLARSMGAGPGRTLLLVRLPAALPALGSGLRLGAVYAPIGAVIGEWVGASQGLGYLMLLANGRAKTDLMFAAVLTLGCLSVLLYLSADWAARRLSATAGAPERP